MPLRNLLTLSLSLARNLLFKPLSLSHISLAHTHTLPLGGVAVLPTDHRGRDPELPADAIPTARGQPLRRAGRQPARYLLLAWA